MRNLALLATIFLASTAASAEADVLVRIQVFQEAADADPQTVPQGEASMTFETQAAPDGRFVSRTRLGKQTYELKGKVNRKADHPDLVSITFTDQGPDGQRQLSTSLMLKPNQPQAVGKSGDRKVVLTVVDAEEQSG